MLSAMVRIWPSSQRLLTVMLKRHVSSYHLLMGMVHGLTNLGGAMLVIFASGTNDGKEAIRYTVAYYYLAFSAIQMLLLATVMGHRDMLLANLPAVVVSALVYLLIGKHIFARASNPFYNSAMTMFIAAYGVAVLFKF